MLSVSRKRLLWKHISIFFIFLISEVLKGIAAVVVADRTVPFDSQYIFQAPFSVMVTDQ